MQTEVFEAFRSIDIPEEKAVKAATALGKRDEQIARLTGDMQLVKWMLGFVLALLVAVLFRVFSH